MTNSVSKEQLQAMAAKAPKSEPKREAVFTHTSSGGYRFDIRKVLDDANIAYTEKKRDYGIAFDLEQCLTSDQHDTGASFIQMESGIVVYRCLHDSCSGKGLSDVEFRLPLPPKPTITVNGKTPDTLEPWTTPIPLGPFYGPPFPLEALSAEHRAFVTEVDTSTQTPPDMAAWASLATVGIAIRGRYVIAPKADWQAFLHIQALQVLESGGGKSPMYRHVNAPIREIEAAAFLEYELVRDTWTLKKKSLESSERKARRDADKATATRDADLALEAVQRELMEHERAEPILKRLTADDATAEALWSIMERQGGAIGVSSPEGGFLANVTGRYSDAPIFEPLLKGYSGDSHTVDRKTDNEHRHIPRAILALSIALQPVIVQNMGDVPGFQTMGVSSRLIMSFPKPVAWPDLDAPAPSETVLAWWHERIREIESSTSGSPGEPNILKLSPEANRAFRSEREWWRQATAEGAFADLDEWGRKYPGMVLRIAGLLHILDNRRPLATPVSSDTLGRAVTIMRPAIEHARIGHTLMAGKSGGHELAKDVLAELQRLGPLVRRSDLNQALRYRVAFDRADKLNTPLTLLEEYGYIQRVKQSAQQNPEHPGGRPVEEIHLNPKYPLTTLTTPVEAPSAPVVGVVRAFPGVEQNQTATAEAAEFLASTQADNAEEWSMDL